MDETPNVTIEGKKYFIRITYADALRVRDATGIDILSISDTGDFSVVNSSVERVVNVVFWLIYKQLMLNYRDIDTARKAFEEALDGEMLERIINVWQEAMVNFIPCLAVREAARRQLKTMTQAQALATIQMIIDTLPPGASGKPSDTPELSE